MIYIEVNIFCNFNMSSSQPCASRSRLILLWPNRLHFAYFSNQKNSSSISLYKHQQCPPFSLQHLALLNRETLTCCRFDIHEMLMDLAHNNLGTKSCVQRYGTIGSSPFRRISKNRTCQETGIPDEYCICAKAKHLSTNDTRVKTAAKDLVAYINSDLLGSTINRNVLLYI